MSNLNQNILQSIFIILMLFSSMELLAQQPTVQNDCVDELKAYPDSLDYLTRAHRLDESMALADSLIMVYGHLDCPAIILIKVERANVFERHLDFETALEIYNEQLKAAQKFQFVEVEVNVRTSLALLYEIVGRPELCEEQLDHVFQLANDHQLYEYLPEYYVRNSSYHRVYVKEGREKAVELAEKAVEAGKKYGVDKSLAGGYMMLGMLAADPKESIIYFKQASNLLYQVGDYIGSMFQERNIAQNFVNQGKFEKALDVLETIDPHIIKYPGQKKVFYQLQRAIIDAKARAYEGLGQKDSVINYLKDYNRYSRLLENHINQETINQLVVENVVQREQEKVASAKRQNRMLLFGLLLLSGITLLLLRLYLLNRKKNQKINEQTQIISKNFTELQKLYDYKSTLLNEVHHRIKNNLQLIISLMTLQKAKMGSVSESDFLDVLSHRINSIALIHDQLYSLKEFDKINVGLYSSTLLKNMVALRPANNVQIEHNVPDVNLNLETVTPLGLIWSELISNSLKYNPNTTSLKIFFELKKADESYSMHYHDNGIGYPEGQFTGNTKGIGHTIIQSLSRQLAAETHTYNSDGAHFTIKFKEKKISVV